MSEQGLYVQLKSHLFLHWFKINSRQCLKRKTEIKKSSKENQKKAALSEELWIKDYSCHEWSYSFPFGYTIQMWSHAKCYSILTRAFFSKKVSKQQKKKKWKERKKAMIVFSLETKSPLVTSTQNKEGKGGQKGKIMTIKVFHPTISKGSLCQHQLRYGSCGAGPVWCKSTGTIEAMSVFPKPMTPIHCPSAVQTKPHFWAQVRKQNWCRFFLLFFFPFCIFFP